MPKPPALLLEADRIQGRHTCKAVPATFSLRFLGLRCNCACTSSTACVLCPVPSNGSKGRRAALSRCTSPPWLWPYSRHVSMSYETFLLSRRLQGKPRQAKQDTTHADHKTGAGLRVQCCCAQCCCAHGRTVSPPRGRGPRGSQATSSESARDGTGRRGVGRIAPLLVLAEAEDLVVGLRSEAERGEGWLRRTGWAGWWAGRCRAAYRHLRSPLLVGVACAAAAHAISRARTRLLPAGREKTLASATTLGAARSQEAHRTPLSTISHESGDSTVPHSPLARQLLV